MDGALRIRPAVVEDAAVAAEIYVVSSNAAFGPWQASKELTEERIARWAADLVRPRYHWWVAELDSAPVGLAGIGPSRDPVAEEVGELDTIAVLPAYWRRGVGRALMARVNDQLDRDGYERAVLWTWADYPAAAVFYPAMGWTRGDQYRDEGRQVSYWRSFGHLDAELDEVLIGGGEPIVVEIVDYDTRWPALFDEHRRRITMALGPRAIRVEHVGSTAVPGLAAKPVIDILVELHHLEDEQSYRRLLENLGYELRVREPGHRMFRTPERDVHVHLYPPDSPDATDYTMFRDWLRAHPEDRARYEHVKRELAGRPWRDMNYYAEAKGRVIEDIKQRARRGADRS